MRGILRWLTFRRLALAVLPTALLTGGSYVAFYRDGGGERTAGQAARPEQTVPAYPAEDPTVDEDVLGVAAEPVTPLEPEPKKKKKKADDPADDVSADPAPPEPDPVADTGAAVRQAVTDTLAAVGYEGAKVEVADGGSTVSVGVRAAQACDPDALTGARLVERIRSGLPEVRTVRVTVRGSGQSLSDYRRARCAPEPGGEDQDGGVVYSKRGSGTFTTPTFTITASTWTVTYRNTGDFFQAFVIKDGKVQPFVLEGSRRGTGTESFRGPGRFRLKINGDDGWSVSVRDGT